MLKELIIITLISVLPLVELRLAIPIGILSGTIALPFDAAISGLSMSPFLVFLTVIITNTLLGVFLFNSLSTFDKFFRKSKYSKIYTKFLDKNRNRVKKYVDKYGIFGLILFISIPIPGSGVYMGVLGAWGIGMKKEKVYLANMLGVIVAATIVTILTVVGIKIF